MGIFVTGHGILFLSLNLVKITNDKVTFWVTPLIKKDLYRAIQFHGLCHGELGPIFIYSPCKTW